MLSLPLPFFTAIFLIFILLRLIRFKNHKLSALTLVTIGLYALQSVLLGVNWSLGGLPRILLPTLAITLPPLTWLTLQELIGAKTRRMVIVTCGLAIAFAFSIYFSSLLGWNALADGIGVSVYAGYGGQLLWTALRTDIEWMDTQPLHMMLPSRRTFIVAGTVLLASAFVDVAVAIDIGFNNSRTAPAIVGFANFALLFGIFAAFAWLGKAEPLPPITAAVEPPPGEEQLTVHIDPSQKNVLDRLNALMVDSKFYLDANLSLDRMARKIGVPSRQISSAVNSLQAMNISQYVNNFRIREACELLEISDMPITEIIYAVGFTTKSNFHREFQRVTGLSPSAYRMQARTDLRRLSNA